MGQNSGLQRLAIILGCAIVLSAYLVTQVGNRFADQDRSVAVKGLSEREFPADRVVWPIMFKEVGNNLIALSQSTDKKVEIIKAFLKEGGIAEQEISVSTPEVFDQQADRYSTQVSPNRYFMTTVVTVNSDKVEDVRRLIAKQGELLKEGVTLSGSDYRYGIEFQYTKLNEVKVDMIKEATQNARATAEQFAIDSDSKLGKIKSASQGQITITNRDPNTPHIKRIRLVSSITYFLKD